MEAPVTYKESLHAAMLEMAKDPLVRFVGYGLKFGARAGGSLVGVPDAIIHEMPVAENLMVGVAAGLALTGLRPVVYLERFDFALCAADAIVNHLDKIALMSRGEFAPAVILRVVVGNKAKPLFTGETHTQDFSDAFAKILDMQVCELKHAAAIEDIYAESHAAMAKGESTMIVEYKDLI